MENIFNPATNVVAEIEKKTTNLPAKSLICAGIGSFVAAKIFRKSGHTKTGNFIASLAVPLLALGAYKKFSNKSKTTENLQTT